METREEIDCEALAADVVNKTRTNVLLTKTTMTSIADRSGFNRLTISKLLDKKKRHATEDVAGSGLRKRCGSLRNPLKSN